MPTPKQLTDQFISDLKAAADGSADKLFDLYAKAATRLGARAQKLLEAKQRDLAVFIGEAPGDAAGKLAFDDYRAAKKAEREANGELEE